MPSEVTSRLARFDRIVSWFGSREEFFAQRLRSIVPASLVARPVPDPAPPCQTPVSDTTVCDMPEAWRAEARLALSRLGWDEHRPFLVVHPGAGGRDKLWPAENFAGVIRRVACLIF